VPIIAFFSPRRPSPASSARSFVSRMADATRSVVAEIRGAYAQGVAQAITEPAELFTPDELPPLDDILSAAAEYNRASDQARRADRGKRAARKILDRLPVGHYGPWLVERVPSGRQTADLDEIRATYKRLGLGDVPMKPAAPSLKVKRVEIAAPVEADFSELVAR
jgi:hypothetical protein